MATLPSPALVATVPSHEPQPQSSRSSSVPASSSPSGSGPAVRRYRGSPRPGTPPCSNPPPRSQDRAISWGSRVNQKPGISPLRATVYPCPYLCTDASHQKALPVVQHGLLQKALLSLALEEQMEMHSIPQRHRPHGCPLRPASRTPSSTALLLIHLGLKRSKPRPLFVPHCHVHRTSRNQP